MWFVSITYWEWLPILAPGLQAMLLALCSALSFFSAQRCLGAIRMSLFTKAVAEWAPGVKVNMQKFNGVAPEIGTWCRREGSSRG